MQNMEKIGENESKNETDKEYYKNTALQKKGEETIVCSDG